jgi:uncharacterized protein involved in outer membrane biogenesis
MKTRRLFWIIPLAALLLVIAVIIALPGLVASTEHRAAIESLASSLTGREVHIGGKLSLALFPEPQLIAERITISGPDQETITAKSLTLDIALNTLLHGRLTARSMTLQSPVIAFPWPLPGGAASVAPPPWLAALHAQINDGQISVGSLQFQNVNADLFTGADGAVSIAGTGNLLAQPVTVSVSLGAVDATGAAPVTVDGQDGDATLHLSGNFSAASTLTGGIAFNAPGLTGGDPALSQPITATAGISVSPGEIALSGLRATSGNAVITGTARLDIPSAKLNLLLAASNLTLPSSLPEFGVSAMKTFSVHLALDANDPILAGVLIPHAFAEADISAAGFNIASFNATLPGNGAFKLSGTVDPSGNLQGNISLNTEDLGGVFQAFGASSALPSAWRQADLNGTLSGDTAHLSLANISGTLGEDNLTGTAVLDRSGATPEMSGALHFDQLDLTPLAAAFRSFHGAGFGADFELTAGRASIYNIPMTRLLVDAAFGPQLVVRRFSASIFGGLAAGGLTVAPDGQIAAAHALLSLPSAAPAAAMLPAGWRPPDALVHAPLSAYLKGAGPAGQLATTIALTLGDINAAAAPVLDLTHLTAAGPLLIRHPSAIGLFKLLGLNAGLAYPGAGSVSLRADITASPSQAALPDFVLSMGDLNATGRIAITADGTINSDIAADTLALPPWPADLTTLWAGLSAAKGKISLSANRVLENGNQIFGPSAGSLAMQQNGFAFTLGKAAFGGGTLSGGLTAALSATAPPALNGTFSAAGIDASAINLPVAFPLAVSSGTMNAQGTLTATGFTPQAWLATLSGSASLTATSGVITGFDLAALGGALTQSPREIALRNACTTGSTGFATLALGGNFANGIFTIANAALQGPDGAVTATGSIDLPDEATGLHLDFVPNVTAPPKLGLAMIGNWASVKKIPAIKPGLSWQPAN